MPFTGQYADGVLSDHGQRQTLVETLSFPSRPGVSRNVMNEFICKTLTAQKGGSGLAIHTSGFAPLRVWFRLRLPFALQ